MSTHGFSLKGIVTNALFIVGVSLLAVTPSRAQTVQLTADINTVPNLSTSPDIESYVAVGDKVYLAMYGSSRANGSDLYVYDTTTSTLTLLKDISPANGSRQVREMVHVDGVLYFHAFVGLTGGELHRYNIATDEFSIVRDLREGDYNSSSPSRIRADNGYVYFQAYVGDGYKVHRYDPSTDTMLRLDEAASLPIRDYVLVDGVVYVLIDSAVGGSRLHRFDETSLSFQPVVLTADGFDPNQFAWPQGLASIPGYLFFVAEGPNNIGEEPFVVDLTNNTIAYVDIRTDRGTVQSRGKAAGLDGFFYFDGYAPDNNNNYMYKLNAADLSYTSHAVSPDSNGFGGVQNFTLVGDQLYVNSLDPQLGYEPYRVDTQTMTSTFIGDVRSSGNSNPERWTAVGNEVWFIADSDVHGKELFRVTADGYQLVEEFAQEAGFGDPRGIGVVGNTFYFNGNEQRFRREVFSLTSPDHTLTTLTDFSSELVSGTVLNTVVTSAGVAFRARDEQSVLQLYYYTEAGGLKQIDRGSLPQPDNLYQFGNRAVVRFFAGGNTPQFYEINAAGELVSIADTTTGDNVWSYLDNDVYPNFYFQGANYAVVGDGGYDTNMMRWGDDGTATRFTAGSFGLSSASGDFAAPIAGLGDLLWVAIYNGGFKLIGVDSNGTVVHQFDTANFVYDIEQIGNYLVFLAGQQAGYQIIDLTDGSSRMAKLPDTYTSPSHGFDLEVLEGRLLATASSVEFGYSELVEIDVANATVSLLAELEAGSNSSALSFVSVLNDRLYMTGRSLTYGDELFVFRFNSEPVISGTPRLTVLQDQAYSFTPTVTDPDPQPQLTFSITNKPSWAAFDTSNGSLTGTPGNADVGEYTAITISVSDGQYSSTLAAFNLTVLNVNDAPTITGTPATSVLQDALYSFTPQATDIDVGAQLSFSISNKPSWASFDSTTGRLSGTPRNADVGDYSAIGISVSDGELSAALPPFAIQVVNVNDAPVITGEPPTIAMTRVAYSYIVQANDIDADDQLTFYAENLPEWLTLNSFSGLLQGTPSDAQAGEYIGIVVGVSDGELSAELPAFSINVEVSNRPPLALNDSFAFTQNAQGSYVLTVLGNDSDPDANDTLEIIGARVTSGPGSVSNNSSALTLTLAPSYVGTVQVSYTIADADGEQAQAVASVTINADTTINLVVPADLTLNATGVNTVVTLAETAQATNGAGVPLAVSLVDFQSSYKSGRHQLLWRATNGTETLTKPQQLIIRPQVSLAKSLTVTPGTAYNVPLTLSGPAPDYPYQVTVMVGDQPVSVSFASGNSALLAQPGLAADGDTLTYSIASTSNPGDVRQITVTARLTNVAPQVTNVRLPLPLVVPTDGDVAVRYTVTDANVGDTATITFALENADTNSPITVPYQLSNGVLSFDPSSLTNGRYRAVVTATDSGGLSGRAATPFTVRVSGSGPRGDDGLYAVTRDVTLSCELDQNNNGFVDCIDGRFDSNGNGIADYLDTSFVAHQLSAGVGEAVSTSGTQLVTYPQQPDGRSMRVSEVPEQPLFINSAVIDAGLDITPYRFIGAFYDFRVQQLASVGATAAVVLPLDEPLPANAQWLIWQGGDWREFAQAGADTLLSASDIAGVCPALGAAAWQPGIVAGSRCVQLQFTDGGVNDTDGIADGAVEMFGGLAVNDAGNTPPVAQDDSAGVVWQGSAIIDVLANDSDPDGSLLTILSARADVGEVVILSGATRLQYNALNNFAGSDTVTYVVSDSDGGLAVATVAVTVLANRAPIVAADNAVTVSGRAVSVNVLANDADPDGDTLSISSVSLSSGSGTLSYSGSTVSFTPALDFVGTAAVAYTVSDGRGAEATGVLTVQVAAPVEVIEVRPATGTFWWFLTLGGLLLAFRRRTHC
ncbi:Ig-like domain-containing protein [Pseudidiomarina mangrovi]|uniref:Ig-like domain-containing protein n=1 Tax=Pseudidiomarina mangrovi TaxID=2487133 RepID=UPI000FC9B35E|nr:Ig-like domain-containing protein [Pseudidiomarina mangrovi]